MLPMVCSVPVSSARQTNILRANDFSDGPLKIAQLRTWQHSICDVWWLLDTQLR
jgi:hypothetical protein